MDETKNNGSSYAFFAQQIKVLADENRLKIIEMLSCGEMCACGLLAGLTITQPTLSHHMKKLVGCGLVQARSDGSWTHYSLNLDNFQKIGIFLEKISRNHENCICLSAKKDCL